MYDSQIVIWIYSKKKKILTDFFISPPPPPTQRNWVLSPPSCFGGCVSKLSLKRHLIFYPYLKNLCRWKLNNINMFSGVFFLLKHNKHCLTFMINIESSLIHSMKSLIIACKQICTDTLFWCIPKEIFFKIRGVCFKITYLYEKSKSFFNFQTQIFSW